MTLSAGYLLRRESEAMTQIGFIVVGLIFIAASPWADRMRWHDPGERLSPRGRKIFLAASGAAGVIYGVVSAIV